MSRSCAKDKSELEIGKIERVMNVLEANDLGGLEVGSYNPDVIFIPEPPHLISVAQHRGDGVLAKPEGTAVSGRRGARHRR